jgi:murein L,D-transpeptidase YafK
MINRPKSKTKPKNNNIQQTTLIVLLIVAVILGFELIRTRLMNGERKARKLEASPKPPADTVKKISVADSIAKTYSSSVFRDEQMKFERVKTAHKQKTDTLMALYARYKLDINSLNIYFRAFKKEQIVEVWAKDKNKNDFLLLKTYKFCKNSGTMGPKRKAGDNQIPEGFYLIDRFNPNSKFYLSLGLNYPNRSDKVLGDTVDLGNDIFIHGDCQTIGCIPITDDKIKEVYLMAVDARAAGQKKIAVSIFPTFLTEANFKKLQTEYKDKPQLLKFWKELKAGFLAFEKCKRLPNITITAKGEYICKADCN